MPRRISHEHLHPRLHNHPGGSRFSDAAFKNIFLAEGSKALRMRKPAPQSCLGQENPAERHLSNRDVPWSVSCDHAATGSYHRIISACTPLDLRFGIQLAATAYAGDRPAEQLTFGSQSPRYRIERLLGALRPLVRTQRTFAAVGKSRNLFLYDVGSRIRLA